MWLKARPTKAKDGGLREVATIFVHALLIAFFVRVFFYQPFNIPSGSMQSTLLIGDYLFVSKLAYGYSRYTFPFGLNLFAGRMFGSEPKRGDVIVFKLPRDNSTDYIKRLIALPGDEVQMKNGALFLKEAGTSAWIEVPRKPVDRFSGIDEFGRPRTIASYEETLPNGVKYLVLDAEQNGPADNTDVFKVPTGHYFMMGDNRDNSLDSRVPQKAGGVGFVPFENLVGRADIVFFSVAADDPAASLFKPWRWPLDIRWSRLARIVR
jgi:signal peptidase I